LARTIIAITCNLHSVLMQASTCVDVCGPHANQ